jgi:hypothetical protein
MNRRRTPRLTALAAVFATATASVTALPAQMEIRQSDRYRASEFAKAAPAVDADAPDLLLWDLGGRPRSLALERGRTLVLIGGSFT